MNDDFYRHPIRFLLIQHNFTLWWQILGHFEQQQTQPCWQQLYFFFSDTWTLWATANPTMLTATSSLLWDPPRWKDAWIPNNSTISLIKDQCLTWIKLLRANTTTTAPTTTTTIQPTVATQTLTECCNIRQPMTCTKPTLTPIPMQCGLINHQCRSVISQSQCNVVLSTTNAGQLFAMDIFIVQMPISNLEMQKLINLSPRL